MEQAATSSGRYVTLVPVKPPARGKSRLGPAGERRRELAAAFALDTVTACLGSAEVARVMAVTDDALFARDLSAVGCAVLPDGTAEDLNATLRMAAAEARRRWSELRPAVVCADLPALRSDDLTTALRAAWPHPAAFVTDAAARGTTLYTAVHESFAPRFGPGSRTAHLAAAVELTGDLPSLRLDVDDASDLQRAADLGLGAHTAPLASVWTGGVL